MSLAGTALLQLRSYQSYASTLVRFDHNTVRSLQREAAVFLQRQQLHAIMQWWTEQLENKVLPGQLEKFNNFGAADVCRQLENGKTLCCTDDCGQPADWLQCTILEIAKIPADKLPKNVEIEVEWNLVTITALGQGARVVWSVDN